MSNSVYANGRELSCKSGAGKTICSFPDVCMTPPECPATPPGVPVPYPNTGLASDTTDGSRTVQISGQEVMMKNKSYFKTSTGDEAGCASKKGVVSSTNKGKVYFIDWSMNVKVEGENAVRHLDKTTNNHGSPTSNESIPWLFIDKASTKAIKTACNAEKGREKKACKGYTPYKKKGKDVCDEAGLGSKFSYSKSANTRRAKQASENPCAAARRCRMSPYKAPKDGINGCCPAQTPDHIIPKSSFFVKSVSNGRTLSGWSGYDPDAAPCMCSEGGSNTGTHGLRHAFHKCNSGIAGGTKRSFKEEAAFCAKSAEAIAPQCSAKCIEAQLKEGHKGMGDLKADVKYSPTGKKDLTEFEELAAIIKKGKTVR
ncbi:MAG: hypothetical protein JWR07_3682 [Nevskia sp.]|nr:hypothetical protein [Nevskia sp.]